MAEEAASPKVAGTASRVSRGSQSGKRSKSAAGSALSQRETGGHKVTLRKAFDIVVRKYGHALKELEKY